MEQDEVASRPLPPVPDASVDSTKSPPICTRSGLKRPWLELSGSTGPRLEKSITSPTSLENALQPRSVSLAPIVMTFFAVPGVPTWSEPVVPQPTESPSPSLPAEKNTISGCWPETWLSASQTASSQRAALVL